MVDILATGNVAPVERQPGESNDLDSCDRPTAPRRDVPRDSVESDSKIAATDP